MRSLFLVLALGAIMLTTPAAGEPTAVTEENIQELLVGKILLGKTSKGKPYKFTLKGDGGQTFNMKDGFYDTGEYFFKDGMFCNKWKKIRGGKVRCSKGVLDGESYSWTYQDGEKSSATVKPAGYSDWD